MDNPERLIRSADVLGVTDGSPDRCLVYHLPTRLLAGAVAWAPITHSSPRRRDRAATP